jgi:hypothetical protein
MVTPAPARPCDGVLQAIASNTERNHSFAYGTKVSVMATAVTHIDIDKQHKGGTSSRHDQPNL